VARQQAEPEEIEEVKREEEAPRQVSVQEQIQMASIT